MPGEGHETETLLINICRCFLSIDSVQDFFRLFYFFGLLSYAPIYYLQVCHGNC